jgi:Cof subfamily protein (haloacid dehalogenase superfamily)
LAVNIRLLGIDLDGTLLDSNKQISLEDEKAIIEVMKKGIVVIPITGRPKSGIPQKVKTLFQNSYWISSNGAVTTVASCKEDIKIHSLKKETVIDILEYLSTVEEKIQIEVIVNGVAFVEESQLIDIKKRYKNTSLETYIETTRKPVPNIRDFVLECQGEILEISIMTDSIEIKKKISNEISKYQNIKITSSINTDLEINSHEASKGLSIVQLGIMIGIDRSEIMACGDSGNDIEMLQQVGIGVAMKNADEDTIKAANYITLSNNESGVAHAIHKFILEGGN